MSIILVTGFEAFGHTPVNPAEGELTAPEGPTAYATTLPIRAMVSAMRAAGIPADISDVAGTFCCNHLMYGILGVLAAIAAIRSHAVDTADTIVSRLQV